MAEVAKTFENIDSSIIANCARKNAKFGKSLSYKGRYFTYELNDKQYVKKYNKGFSKSIEVTDMKGDITVFKSFVELARFLDLKEASGGYISKLVRKGKTYKGLKIKIIDDKHNDKIIFENKKLKKQPKKTRA